MARNANGVYSVPPGSTAVLNTEIDPVAFNALISDIANDLNLPRPVTAGGTGASTVDAALTNFGFTTIGKALRSAANTAAAWTTLGITNLLVPTGTVAHFYRLSAPPGWLECNGQSVSRTTYAALWAAMGSPDTGDGSTTFTITDMRGEFLRGQDRGRGVDASRGLGSAQAAAMLNHTHSGTTDTEPDHTHNVTGTMNPPYAQHGGGGAQNGDYVASRATSPAGAHNHAFTTGNPSVGGGNETRPRNVALMICIKT